MYWNDVKPHDFNLRTLLGMELLKYETTYEDISLTNAKTMMRVHCKRRPYTQLVDLHGLIYVWIYTQEDVSVYNL